MSKRQKIFLVCVLLLSAFLIFFRLPRASIQRDDAHYSFRAFGYIDYMSSDKGQTTPLQWFAGEMPLWTNFSFHDHPPLVFLVQNIFFNVFGANDFAAKLPFALAGLLLVYVVFLLGRELFSARVGLVAAFLLSINSYHIWISRVGYFEGITVLLMALCLLFLFKSKKNEKYFLLMGVFLGLACLSKYTGLILLPIIIIYALINFRRTFKNAYFWSSLFLALILFSPVIIYNLKMFETTGHADVQFTALFKLPTVNWPILANRSNWQSHNLLAPLGETVRTLGDLVSWPWLTVYFLSFLYIFFRIYFFRRQETKKATIYLAVISIVMLLFFMVTGGVSEIYLAPLNFLLAIALGLALCDVYDKILVDSKWLRYVCFAVAAVFAVYGIFFAYNTNLRLDLMGNTFFVSKYRLEDLGFGALQKYLSAQLGNKYAGTMSMRFSTLNRFNPMEGKSGIYQGKQENNAIFIYDDNTIWFARLWYFERWSFYDFFPFFPTRNLKLLGLSKDMLAKGLPFKGDMYFIKALQKNQLDKYAIQDPGCVDKLADELDKLKDKEVINIADGAGRPAFRVYKFWNLASLLACEEYL